MRQHGHDIHYGHTCHECHNTRYDDYYYCGYDVDGHRHHYYDYRDFPYDHSRQHYGC